MFNANLRRAVLVFGVIARRELSSARKGVVRVQMPPSISQNWSEMFATKFIPSEFLMKSGAEAKLKSVIKIPFSKDVTEFFGDIFFQDLRQNVAKGCDKSAACLQAIEAFKSGAASMIHVVDLPKECSSLYAPFFDNRIRDGALGAALKHAGYMPAMALNAAFASCVGLESYGRSEIPFSTIVSSVFVAQGTNRQFPHRDDLNALPAAKKVKAKPDLIDAISIQAIFSDANIATYLIESAEIYEKLSDEMRNFLSQEIFYLKNTRPNLEKYKFKILEVDKDGKIIFNFDGDLFKAGLIACDLQDQIFAIKMIQEFFEITKKMMEESSLEVVLKSHEAVLFAHQSGLHGRNPKDDRGDDLKTGREIIGTLWRKKGQDNVVKLNKENGIENEK